MPDAASENKAKGAETVEIAPKGPGTKNAARGPDAERETVEVKEGGNRQVETKRGERGWSDTGQTRPSPGANQLRFVFI